MVGDWRQNRVGWGLTGGLLLQSGWRRFEYISNSNYFKTFQTLTDPKMALTSPKNFEIKYGFEALEWISIENSENSLGYTWKEF
jgi:hypothetical protein